MGWVQKTNPGSNREGQTVTHVPRCVARPYCSPIVICWQVRSHGPHIILVGSLPAYALRLSCTLRYLYVWSMVVCFCLQHQPPAITLLHHFPRHDRSTLCFHLSSKFNHDDVALLQARMLRFLLVRSFLFDHTSTSNKGSKFLPRKSTTNTRNTRC